jgi:hypothetical protein
VVQETIDYNDDNRADFLITLNTQTGDTTLSANCSTVLSTERSYRLKKGWAVRVILKK